MAEDGQNRDVPNQPVTVGTRLNGVFEIEQKIAAGGMGEVFRGRNIATSELVAIKIILPEFSRDEMIRELFFKEARVLGSLNHPSIVRYHMFAVEPVLGRPYLVMEYIDGWSLDSFIRNSRPSIREVKTFVAKVADALSAAHHAGVIHRDLSPDNILLASRDLAQPKIIDFGIARTLQSGATILGNKFAGRENFASPEQYGLYGGNVTELSDVYCLGLIIVAMLRGEAIDMSGTQYEQVEKRRRIPDLADIDPELQPILRTMLQPDPADRHTTMKDIAALLTGQASIPPSVPEHVATPATPMDGVQPETQNASPLPNRNAVDQGADDVWAAPTPLDANQQPLASTTPFSQVTSDTPVAPPTLIRSPVWSETEHSPDRTVVIEDRDRKAAEWRSEQPTTPQEDDKAAVASIAFGSRPADGQPGARRLAAIFALDVVGYSRMMENDEAGALAAWKGYLDHTFAPAAAAHRGRIIKLIGDGALVEFASVVDAVQCAIAVQTPPAPASATAIVVRIGINLGDVIIDGDDIYGDGVNIAARLEPLAAPGGICISGIVKESIGNRVALAFEDGGDVMVKNIDRPIRIWRWQPGAAAKTTSSFSAVPLAPAATAGRNVAASRSRSRLPGWLGGAVGLALLATVGVYVLNMLGMVTIPHETASDDSGTTQPGQVDDAVDLPHQNKAVKDEPPLLPTQKEAKAQEEQKEKEKEKEKEKDTAVAHATVPSNVPDTRTSANQQDEELPGTSEKAKPSAEDDQRDAPASTTHTETASHENPKVEDDPKKTNDAVAQPTDAAIKKQREASTKDQTAELDASEIARREALKNMLPKSNDVPTVRDKKTDALKHSNDAGVEQATVATPTDDVDDVPVTRVTVDRKKAEPKVEPKKVDTEKEEPAVAVPGTMKDPANPNLVEPPPVVIEKKTPGNEEIVSLPGKIPPEVVEDPQPRTPGDWVRMFDGGPCFFADATEVASKAVGIVNVTNDLQKSNELDGAFIKKFGYEVQVRIAPIDDSQCLATSLLNTLSKLGPSQVRLKLDTDIVENGSSLGGSVLREDNGNGPIALLLVDRKGWVYDISDQLKAQEDGSLRFGGQIQDKGLADGKFRIVLALAGADELVAEVKFGPVKSEVLVPRLIDAAKLGGLEYGYGFFKIRKAK